MKIIFIITRVLEEPTAKEEAILQDSNGIVKELKGILFDTQQNKVKEVFTEGDIIKNIQNIGVICVKGNLKRNIDAVKKILEAARKKNIDIIAICHPGGGRSIEDVKKLYPSLGNYLRGIFSTSGTLTPNDVKTKLENTFQNVNSLQQFQKAVKELYDFFLQNAEKEQIRIIRYFSILKHRIAHLFLPLDIDLQGVKEVKEKQSKDKAVEYLKDVLGSKQDTKFYRQKLADLQFMIAKVSKNNENPELNCDSAPSEKELVKPNITADALPDKKSILDLIPEDKRYELKTDWEILLKLSGLGLRDKKNNQFDQESLEPKFDSPIFHFMRLLDCKIQKYSKDSNSINISDVNEILDFESLKKLLENIQKSSTFHLPSSGLPFHDWFVALDECLDKLRELISSLSIRCQF